MQNGTRQQDFRGTLYVDTASEKKRSIAPIYDNINFSGRMVQDDRIFEGRCMVDTASEKKRSIAPFYKKKYTDGNPIGDFF